MTKPHVSHALDCSRARTLIDAFLLDELHATDAARLAAHVKGCAACAAEIGGSTRVLGLLGSLPVERPTFDLDERILFAALDDRARRHDRRSWLSDLRTQVLRGAMRTTGTLMVTILSVAVLGGVFVFAASQFVIQLPVFTGNANIPPVATPTLTPTPAAQTAEPTTNATPQPSPPPSASPGAAVTAAPTESVAPAISPEPSASPTPEPSATPEPTESPTPSIEPSPSATAEPPPPPTPEPSPTEKPRRTPPPSGDPTPSP